jgi:hypothetical protein
VNAVILGLALGFYNGFLFSPFGMLCVAISTLKLDHKSTFLPATFTCSACCFFNLWSSGLPDGLVSNPTPSFGTFWKAFEWEIL